jgi:hypothetical protein
VLKDRVCELEKQVDGTEKDKLVLIQQHKKGIKSILVALAIPNPYFSLSFLESRQQGVDFIQQCHEEVKQANIDRDVEAKKAERKITLLKRQAFDLIEDRNRIECKLETKLRD